MKENIIAVLLFVTFAAAVLMSTGNIFLTIVVGGWASLTYLQMVLNQNFVDFMKTIVDEENEK